MNVYSVIVAIVLCSAILLVSMTACQPIGRGAEYQMIESIMDSVSNQDALHASIQKDHIVNGVLERGNIQEIWKCSNNYAMTIHISATEHNTLYYDGRFYVQQTMDGSYEESNDRFTVPDLWAGVLNDVTADNITSATLEKTEFGRVLTVSISKEGYDDADITGIIALDAVGNVISIVTKAAWEATSDGQTYSVEAIYTTQFLSFEEDEVIKTILDRVEKISPQQRQSNTNQ